MRTPSSIDYGQAFEGAMWFDVVPRSAACPNLPPCVLLHAGPPFRGSPPAPVLNAAIQALIFDGLASDEAGARDLLSRGSISLQPAQDHQVLTPLAQVVSSSMPLVAVKHHDQICYGAMLEGPSPALRFGSAAPACRQRLKFLSATMARAVAPLLRRAPVDLAAVIRHAAAAGEDCHARTALANEELVSNLRGLDADVESRLRALAAFVLPILMAGGAAALRHHRCAVEALGGNGVDFGVRRRGDSTWRQLPSQAPHGDPLPGVAAAVPLPAIGDSVVIDFCGLGGQADASALRRSLTDPRSGIVDPARIAGGAGVPVFNLAMLDVHGEAGLIGRGAYRPPVGLFAEHPHLTPREQPLE